jgi:ElaB/YqjD/DUF883 family membrane-anchored ribosome-binding protein
MSSQQSLCEEIHEIAKHISALRKEFDGLSGSFSRACGLQAERVQDAASEAVEAIEAAVRRTPIQTLGIALGIGFLVGVVLAR